MKLNEKNAEVIGPVTIKAGFGFWDITRYPKGGDFRRAANDLSLQNVAVATTYETGEVREFTGSLTDGHRVCVQSECCDF